MMYNTYMGLSIWLVILCRRFVKVSGQAELPSQHAMKVV